MSQLAHCTGQATADLSQALCLGQLTEKHGHEMRPTCESLGTVLKAMLDNQSGEHVPVEDLQDLTENTCVLHSFGSSSWYRIVVCTTQKCTTGGTVIIIHPMF